MSPTRLVHVVTVPATLSLMRGQLGFLSRSGYDVHVVASLQKAAIPLDPSEGVTLHSVNMSRRVEPFRDARSLAEMSALLRRLKPGIVQAGTPKGALLGTLGGLLARVPVRIHHVRGLAYQSGRAARALPARAAAGLSCAAATHVLCVSESVRSRLVADGLCPARKTHVLLHGSSNGVDAAGRFNPARLVDARREVREGLGIAAEARVIGFVGRLVRDKGIEDLAAAWRNLRDAFPDVILLLAGPFEPEDPFSPAVRAALQADPRVKITETGWGESAPLYAAMDLVCFPSHREGFPNVPLEAAAMALPVVAAKVVGSVDAVVHEQTGLLVEPRDPRELEQALRRLLGDPDFGKTLGERGRERALLHYAPEALWRAQVDWYREIMNDSPVAMDASRGASL